MLNQLNSIDLSIFRGVVDITPKVAKCLIFNIATTLVFFDTLFKRAI